MSTRKASLSQALGAFDRRATVNQPPVDQHNRRLAKAPSREGKRAIAGFFSPEVSKQLKTIGIERDASVQDMLAEALNLFFEKHGRSPIA